MEKIQYKLENFEGPLDLLLYLISKHKLNINDIEIFTLVEQYTDYVRQMQEADMDIASEFIEMAARLVYIKTVSLLPVHEEAEKLKEELSGQLIEYSKCKEIAAQLAGHTEGFDTFIRQPARIKADTKYKRIHDVEDLVSHYLSVLSRGKKLPPPVSSFSEIISKRIVSVDSRINYIFKRLSNGVKCKLRDIYSDSKSISEMVATFLAVLELAKSKKLIIDNNEIIRSVKGK